MRNLYFFCSPNKEINEFDTKNITSYTLLPQNKCLDSYNLLIIRAFMLLNAAINTGTINIEKIQTKDDLYEALQKVERYFKPTMEAIEYYLSLPENIEKNNKMIFYKGILNFLYNEYGWSPICLSKNSF